MSKQNQIEQYINTIVGGTITTASLCVAAGCTLPTVLSYIKNNPHRFEKVKRGTYTILAAKQEMQAGSTSSVAVETPLAIVDSNTFDW